MCWIENLDFIFWLHFGIGQQRIAAANFKKKTAHTSAVVEGTTPVCAVSVYYETFCAIFQRGF